MTHTTQKDGVTLPSVSELAERFFGKFNVERLDFDTALELIKRRFILESSEIIETAKHKNNSRESQANLELKIKRTVERAAKFDIFEDDLICIIRESRERLNNVLLPKNLG